MCGGPSKPRGSHVQCRPHAPAKTHLDDRALPAEFVLCGQVWDVSPCPDFRPAASALQTGFSDACGEAVDVLLPRRWR